MNVLFIREYPKIDGTFTLLIRMAAKMQKDGHNAYFLLIKHGIDKGLLTKISDSAPILYYEQLEALKISGNLPEINVIHGIVSGEILYKTYDHIKREYFPYAAVVLGIYHPRAYIIKTIVGSSPDTLIYKGFFKKIPKQNLLFMNEMVRQNHESFFNIDFSKSPIVPLLVDIPQKIPVRNLINKNKIVSIGRLVSFKSYVFPIIELIALLNKKGYAFEYHVYGTGPLYNKVENLIKKLNAQAYIYLHGYLPYINFNEVIKDALLFIGMGTSVIESSSQGVPSLLAIESITYNATYGWFFDQKGFEVGEQIPGKVSFSFEPFILEAHNADSKKYDELCVKSWSNSRKFSTENVMTNYYNFMQNADPNFNFVIPAWKKVVLKFTRQFLKFNFFVKVNYRHK
jgi:glycosyltransferase involved in cell wall biosynthesis